MNIYDIHEGDMDEPLTIQHKFYKTERQEKARATWRTCGVTWKVCEVCSLGSVVVGGVRYVMTTVCRVSCVPAMCRSSFFCRSCGVCENGGQEMEHVIR